MSVNFEELIDVLASVSDDNFLKIKVTEETANEGFLSSLSSFFGSVFSASNGLSNGIYLL